MIVDPAIIPGFLLLGAELAALAAVGYIVVRVALRQTDERVALAQGPVVGLALWGLIVNFAMYAVPGLAGAIVGWGIVVAVAAGLVWRSSTPIRPRPRVVAGFAVVAIALLCIALASRQSLSIPDPGVRLGLAASIRAGGFPPELSWNPGTPANYHHGIPLLVGLLAPPVGPDLAFVTELLGAWAWASLALVVITLLLQRSSGFAVAVTAPLLLTAGAWTFAWLGDGLLTAPVPAGLPAAGLRASLAELYWPSVDLPPGEGSWDPRELALPNMWKPGFPLAYALLFVVLERVAQAGDRSWPAVLTLGGLVGFVGLLATTLAPVALALWAGLEAVHLGRAWRNGALARSAVLRSGVGLALAMLLLLGGGGVFTGLLGNAASPATNLAWNAHQQGWRLLGEYDSRPGGVGLLGMGPVVVAVIAALLAHRDRLVLTLCIGAGGLALAYLALDYPPAAHDTDRLAGHARNFALVALLLALSVRLAGFAPRWRYAVGGLLVALVVWPTIAPPLRGAGQALGRGIEAANAGVEPAGGRQARFSLADHRVSDRVAAYIRDHTAADARVLTPERPFMAVTFATGRPSAAGFIGYRHLGDFAGPEYLDALHHLEPRALRRLGVSFVHAPDSWVAELPERAVRWIADPTLFEPVVRDGDETLYRVRTAFLALDAAPEPETYEALRQAVPAAATVYWPEKLASLGIIRVAGALPQSRVLSRLRGYGHFVTSWPAESLGAQTPDLVILPTSLPPSMFPPSGRQPIWWNAGVAVYAPLGAVASVMPPPQAAPPKPPVGIRMSDVRVSEGRLAFTVTVNDHAPDQWTGQDWQLVAGEASPWAIPTALEPDGRTPVIAQWFAGQAAPGRDTTTHHYVFDARTSRLALRDDGRHVDIATSGDGVGEGVWMLALRLQRGVDRGAYVAHEDVAIVPLLQIEISETGQVTGFAYGHLPGAEIEPTSRP